MMFRRRTPPLTRIEKQRKEAIEQYRQSAQQLSDARIPRERGEQGAQETYDRLSFNCDRAFDLCMALDANPFEEPA